MLNFITGATFLMETFVFMLYPHTAPNKQLYTNGKNWELIVAALGWIPLSQKHESGRMLSRCSSS